MPEMPEVEAVCSKLRGAVGRRIVAVKAPRCATPAVRRSAPGRTIDRVDRRGKHILVRLSGDKTLHVHLRMTGNFYPVPDHRLHPANARVVFALDNGSGLVFEDTRALGRMELAGSPRLDAALERQLGAEPLSAAFSVDHLIAEATASRQTGKIFLMDQRRVAGLGNIYAAEALYRAGIDPRRSIQGFRRKRLERLHFSIVRILEDAVQSACIAYSGPGEFAEAESFPLAVYGMEGEPCHSCGRVIRRIAQGGRSTYFCPGCQR